MKKLPNKQRSAREKYFEDLYLKEKEKNNVIETELIDMRVKLAESNERIKELEYFQALTPEEIEEMKVAVKKIVDFQDSELGQFMGSSLMPVLPILRRIRIK